MAEALISDEQFKRSMEGVKLITVDRRKIKEEAPGAYKDFDEVLGSVKQAGLAREVARLEARFVIKDAAKADD